MKRAKRANGVAWAIVVVCGLALGTPGSVLAAITMTEFPVSAPWFITSGPDGNMWVTQGDGSGSIGRITPGGIVSEFPIPTPGSYPRGITAGPDGNLWFTEEVGNKIGRITPAGVITEFAIPSPESHPWDITGGPDGNLWFSHFESLSLGRVTPSGVITEIPFPRTIINFAFGPDGNLWFPSVANTGVPSVIRFGLDGATTEFPLPIDPAAPPPIPGDIVSGPDGNLWVTELGQSYIARVTPDGVATTFQLEWFSVPLQIAVGPDGNLWFTKHGDGDVAPAIGRITPAGVITEFPVPASVGRTVGIAAGPEDTVWFTGENDTVVRITFEPDVPPRLPEPDLVGIFATGLLMSVAVAWWRRRRR